MTRRESLEKEIEALDRIIRSDTAGLKLTTLSASDRNLLEKQIKTRTLALAVLRQQLAVLSN